MTIFGGALGAALVACGDDDSASPGGDAGNDRAATGDTGGGGGGDGGGTDGATEGGPAAAKIIVVHAATDYGPNHRSGVVRVCYATKQGNEADFTMSPLVPLPHSVPPGGASPFPGIPIGAGGPFPSTGAPLETLSIRPYVMNALSLAQKGVVGNTGAAAQLRCPRLLGAPNFVPDGGWPDGGATEPFQENRDYWRLADIPAGTFKNGKTYMLAIFGCTSDVGAEFTGKCGPDTADGGAPYVPTGTAGPGNLKVLVLELDAATTVAADEIGAQVVHLSPQYQALRSLGTIPPFVPVMGNPDAGDAGIRYVSPDGGPQEVPFNVAATAAQPMAKVKGIATATGFFAANESSGLGGGPFIPVPLNNTGGTPPRTIQFVSQGKLAPEQAQLYVNGKRYTFVLVGDPQQPDGGLRGPHYLGFENVFTPPSATQ